MSLVDSIHIQKLIYWLFNSISPSINAQVIITYILAQNSEFCRVFTNLNFSSFQTIGDNTIRWNWIILILHIIVLFSLLVALDSGLLKFSFSCLLHSSSLDESILDGDVLAERHRVLNLNYSTINKSFKCKQL